MEKEGGWVWDAWYVDDGQVLLPPGHAAAYLTAFDQALAQAGGTRIADGVFKSMARLVGSEEAKQRVPASWADGVVRNSCRIVTLDDGTKVLGAGLTGDTLLEQVQAVTQHTADVCKALLELDDSPAELALLRMSANACRVTHLLRAAGPELPSNALQSFDDGQRKALAAMLGGVLPDPCWERAACAARDGGLGLRRCADLRLPAFLASRTDARSLSEELAQGLPDEWQNALFDTWDTSTRAALQEWSECLEPATAAVAQQIIDESASLSERRTAQLAGRLPRDPLSDANGFAARTTAHLLAPVGLEDPEHPDAPADGLQTRLADLVTKGRLDRVREILRCAGDFEGLQVLSDQCDAATDHSWLWALAAADGSIVPSDEFITAVRLRLGAPVIDVPTECARCGGTLDVECRQALRCAPGPATRGHNRVRDTLLGLANLGDGNSSTEERGLVPSAPTLRPADLLTEAAFGRCVAFDVVVASPAAEGAGDDACASAVRRKLASYGPHLEELAREGIEYRPLAWTCWGRPHPDACAAIRSMAQSAARRQSGVCATDLERRSRSAISIQLWRRAAKMVAACRPKLGAEDAALVLPAAVLDACNHQQHLDDSDSDDCQSHASTPRSPPVFPPEPPTDLALLPAPVGGAPVGSCAVGCGGGLGAGHCVALTASGGMRVSATILGADEGAAATSLTCAHAVAASRCGPPVASGSPAATLGSRAAPGSPADSGSPAATLGLGRAPDA